MHPFWPLIFQKISLNIDSDLRNLAAVLSWFEAVRPLLNDDMVWQQCRIAMVEAFTNAVRHAHRELPQETPVCLEAILEEDVLVLKVCDRGAPFDLEHYLRHLPPSSLDAEGGRGLRLIQDIADQLSYRRDGDRGNCLQIVKQLVPQSVVSSKASVAS